MEGVVTSPYLEGERAPPFVFPKEARPTRRMGVLPPFSRFLEGKKVPFGYTEAMVRLPEDLRRELEAALGHPVPEALSQEEVKVLGKEVSAKAPALFRPLADLVGEEVRQAAKHKPESKAVRPSGLLRYLYVQDKDGNWVPSRERHIALVSLLFLAFLAFAYVMMIPPGKPRGASQAPPPTPSPPLTAPPQTTAAAGEEQSGGEAPPRAGPSAAGTARTQGAGLAEDGTVPPPPVPLPGPTPDLPPPPDYVPSQGEGAQVMEGLTVLYTRSSGGEGQGEAAQPFAFYARPAPQGEEGLTLLSVRSVPQVQAREGEAEGVGSFWSRSKEGEGGLVAASPSVLAQGEDKEAPKGLDVQGLGGASGGGDERGGGLQVYAPVPGSSQAGAGAGEPGKPGELQIVWRRAQEQVRGGVVPPGAQTASSPAPGASTQGSPRLPSGNAQEGAPDPPPSGAP